MKKIDSWSSEFRKKRFYENKEIKNIKREEEYWKKVYNTPFESPQKIDKTIAVMLDLDGTCDNIDDIKASVFISQLEVLRKKFGTDYCTISISTHANNPNKIIGVLDILSRNLIENIRIGTSFYYGGRYHYDTKSDIGVNPNFNHKKVDTFVAWYVNNLPLESDSFKNQWFAIVDDCIADYTYKEFQNKHPMLLARPSQRYLESYSNNFMSIATTTDGFDGVIEIFDNYINSIKNLSKNEILDKQKNMINHLSVWELMNKITDGDYNYVERYFKEGYADFDDYRRSLHKIDSIVSNLPPYDEKSIYLKNLYNLTAKFFRNKLALEKSESNKALIKSLNNLYNK